MYILLVSQFLNERGSMFYAISWFISLALLSMWSVFCWGLHAVTVWVVSNAGALTGGTAVMDPVLVPVWLKGWIPPELAQQFEALVASVGPIVQTVLATIPALSGTVTVLAWVVWLLGAATLLALAMGAHVAIAVMKRRTTGSNGPGRAAAQ